MTNERFPERNIETVVRPHPFDLKSLVIEFALQRETFTVDEVAFFLSQHMSVAEADHLPYVLDVVLDQAEEFWPSFGVTGELKRVDDTYQLVIGEVAHDEDVIAPIDTSIPFEKSAFITEVAVKRLMWYSAKNGISMDAFMQWIQRTGLSNANCRVLAKTLEEIRVLDVTREDKAAHVRLDASITSGLEARGWQAIRDKALLRLALVS